MRAVVKDNSGASASYGLISDHLKVGEVVEIVHQDGGCFKIKKYNGDTYVLNVNRFEVIQ